MPDKINKDVEFLNKLCLMDDLFMTQCFKDIKCVEVVLQVILNRRDLVVQSAKTQEVLQGWGRSVKLDIFAIDKNNKGYDIEIQRADDGASFKRARFNSSSMDIHSLAAGEDFDALRDNYIIFITQNDVLKLGLPLYTIECCIRECGKFIEDGSHIIYVNGALRNLDTQLGRLMHDFFCVNPDEMYYSVLAERVRFFKRSREGVEKMISIIDEIKSEGRYEGELKKAKQTVANLLKIGKLTLAEIAESVGLDVTEVKELARLK